MASVFELELDEDEQPIAKSFLGKEGDESNSIYLTSHRLILVRRSKPHDIPLTRLSSLYIANKKLLFPIIFGGISSSLSIAALYSNFYNPYYLLLGFLAGLGLLYWGYTGSRALCLVEGNQETNLFLRSFDEPLMKFVAFVNQYKNTPSASLLKFYLVVKDSKDIKTIKHTPLLTLSELRSQEYDVEYHVAEIDSTEKGMAVVYKIDDSQKIYRPYLKDISSVDGLQFVRVNNLQELFSKTF